MLKTPAHVCYEAITQFYAVTGKRHISQAEGSLGFTTFVGSYFVRLKIHLSLFFILCVVSFNRNIAFPPRSDKEIAFII